MYQLIRTWGLLLLFSLPSSITVAQFIRAKTPLTIASYGTFSVGDTLVLGQGSGPLSHYRYIHEKQTFFNLEPVSLASGHQGQRVVIQAVQYWQGWHHQWPYLLIRVNDQVYRVALTEALQANEVLPHSP
ncbi:MAG: hypothetical protein EOO61_15815 [Hymenobacter sp.]|nr:MAG: hypothetical protein EOO61_15815 [Hymenobacter sp.]